MPVLRIEGHPPIPAEPGKTLLQAALAAGIALPHGCRSGLCGACRVALLDGEIDHDPHAPAALTAAERARGLILACRARPRGDVRLALPDARPEPPPRPRRFVTRVLAADRLGPQVLGLALVPPPGGLAFRAGQYATLSFAGAAPRDFSFAGLPGDPALVFHLRQSRRPGTAETAGRLRPGDAVTVEAPFGTAYFRPADPAPLLLVAAGTGLAPMLSVARAALAADPDRPVTLFRPAPPPGDRYGVDDLARLATGHARCALRETDPAALVAAVVAAATGRPTIHAAGPPEMVAALRHGLDAAGRRPAALRADSFTAVG
ncbi:2Fe-2S iron-sulfur cluster-binding protein [Stella sp.]|uniref:2Fe-2S iron-sulfur cluster-binding protein n=1 Tax=Stella sp. TaxID=2912054 RepID=UPI0035ADE39A